MKSKSKNVTFHVWIIWDPVHYLSPHFVMKSLEQISIKKSGKIIKTPLTCPEPRIRKYQTLYKVLKFITEYSNLILFIGFILLLILIFIYFAFGQIQYENQELKEKENNQNIKYKNN